ncbi:meiotically up-regulated 71 protein [Moesziomyces antarcticus]|uniref:Uncharacterized protein n=2 Tax=Pseudozyma antarctica TaxID=84753 RepID=A0A5C3FXH8_PSEA2|nr:meiotically up-regulated 71 protein [Moesziomyces antarcticus]GAK67674.1 meiotically up-regulated 71 protein [Moesziomyces antarcticus]SPO49094.1 uncharacterized protein PSANT_06785 [Moesziomyces antarcticus]
MLSTIITLNHQHRRHRRHRLEDNGTMKVVGLLSGGKDSCYNLVHCVQQGHELVALATLAPPGSKDELDSYMYQTVGHDAVHLVAAALGLPLYRREIKGTAVNQRSEYGSRAPASSSSSTHGEALDDETEDLYHLLRDVKSHHPDVEAVSVGAILSNYQRVRVEHVALRPDLGLTPLTFLWQRDQAQLYAEMLDAGLVAVLIKVAGIGLDERDLGKTLGQMQPKLTRLAAMYGAHVCGEGGEYETLAVDSPLFKQRIDLQDVETVVHSDSGFGSVSYLRLKNAVLVPKDVEQSKTRATTPPLLDALGERTLAAARAAYQDEASTESGIQELTAKTAGLEVDSPASVLPAPSARRSGRYVVLSNITGVGAAEVEDQVRAAFDTVRKLLLAERLGMEHIAHVNLYVRSQTLFSRINAVYREQFGVSPPTRACVALPLPPGCELVLSIVAFDTAPEGGMVFDRRALHVQGRSFWAPANIGPYSQSLLVAEKIWVAGQIGLVPADLSLPEDAPTQAALSIQHARRIVKATVNDLGGRKVQRGWVEGGICWIEHAEDVHARLEMARHAWLAQCVEDEEEEGEGWMGKTEGQQVGLLMVTLPRAALPRGTLIEWQLTAHTGRVPPPISAVEVDEDDVGSDCDVRVVRTRAVVAGMEAVHTVTTSRAGQSSFGLLTLRITSEDPVDDEAFAQSIDALTSAYAVHLFLPLLPRTSQALSTLRSILPSIILDTAQHVPCTSLHTPDPTLQHVDVALAWHGI